jgi:hypothetical protein
MNQVLIQDPSRNRRLDDIGALEVGKVVSVSSSCEREAGLTSSESMQLTRQTPAWVEKTSSGVDQKVLFRKCAISRCPKPKVLSTMTYRISVKSGSMSSIRFEMRE